MKVRLVEDLQLIVTPENYVEQVALSKWADVNPNGSGLLIEACAEQSVRADGACTCAKPSWGHDDGFTFYCSVCGKPARR